MQSSGVGIIFLLFMLILFFVPFVQIGSASKRARANSTGLLSELPASFWIMEGVFFALGGVLIFFIASDPQIISEATQKLGRQEANKIMSRIDFFGYIALGVGLVFSGLGLAKAIFAQKVN